MKNAVLRQRLFVGKGTGAEAEYQRAAITVDAEGPPAPIMRLRRRKRRVGRQRQPLAVWMTGFHAHLAAEKAAFRQLSAPPQPLRGGNEGGSRGDRRRAARRGAAGLLPAGGKPFRLTCAIGPVGEIIRVIRQRLFQRGF